MRIVGPEQRHTKAMAMAELKDLSHAARQIAAAASPAQASPTQGTEFPTAGPATTVMRMKMKGGGSGPSAEAEGTRAHDETAGGFQWRFFHHNVSCLWRVCHVSVVPLH